MIEIRLALAVEHMATEAAARHGQNPSKTAGAHLLDVVDELHAIALHRAEVMDR